MPQYPATQPIVIDIVHSVGDIEIVLSEQTDATAEVTPTDPNKRGDISLASDATVSFENGTLSVRVPKRFTMFRKSDSADVTVHAPTGSALRLESGYGTLRVRGRVGDAVVNLGYGGATIDDSGALDIRLPYGILDVGLVDGPLVARVGYGDTRIRTVTGEASIHGSHGNITLGAAEGNLDVTTAGSFELGAAATNTTVRSSTGSIRLDRVGSGVVSLTGAHGSIAVGVPLGTAAWVDASTGHGSVRNELSTTGAPDSGKTVEVHARTAYGDVRIFRAAETGARS